MTNQNTNGNGRILEEYRELIREGEYDEAEKLERCRRVPYTLLNSVISEAIVNGNRGLARKLVDRFRQRGYDDNWLGKARYKRQGEEVRI